MIEHNVTELAIEQDIQMIDKIASLNRRNGGERTFHAKGAGARGYFQAYMPMTDYTSADFLQDPEQVTPVFVRFSTTVGARGSADTLRDERGFAVKFYTQEGNYDLISASLPIQFSNRPQKILQALETLMPDPKNNLVSQSWFWDFAAKNPESIHKILWLFSDRGTLKSYRHMESFGVGTSVWINEKGDPSLVRYQWRPLSGRKEIGRQEAEFLAGFDPDASGRDLYAALQQGERPEYELCVRMASLKGSECRRKELLNAALLWPEEEFPLIRVGKLTLTENPKCAWEETEKAAFCPSQLPPGIKLAMDYIQPALVIACTDEKRHRLGTGETAQVNRPLLSSKPIKQSGLFASVWGNETAVTSVDGGLKDICSESREEEEQLLSQIFQQAGEFYRSLTQREKDHLIGNLLDHLLFLEDEIKKALTAAFTKADPLLGEQLSRCMDV